MSNQIESIPIGSYPCPRCAGEGDACDLCAGRGWLEFGEQGVAMKLLCAPGCRRHIQLGCIAEALHISRAQARALRSRGYLSTRQKLLLAHETIKDLQKRGGYQCRGVAELISAVDAANRAGGVG